MARVRQCDQFAIPLWSLLSCSSHHALSQRFQRQGRPVLRWFGPFDLILLTAAPEHTAAKKSSGKPPFVGDPKADLVKHGLVTKADKPILDSAQDEDLKREFKSARQLSWMH